MGQGPLVWVAAACCPTEPEAEVGPPPGCMLSTSTSPVAWPLSRAATSHGGGVSERWVSDPVLIRPWGPGWTVSRVGPALP